MPAAPPLDFLPPRLDGRVLALARLVLPLWLSRRSRIRELTVRHGERLVRAMQAFETGESRLLLAFRHPSSSDPLCLAALLWRELPRQGRRLGLPLRRTPHSFFLYDRGIPLWAGAPVGWLLQRLGGSSILRGRLDTAGLRSARELLLHGCHPFAAAPEGATNGHNELVSPLEPGIAQLAFWTAEDLRKAGRSEAMTVLPIGLQYTWSLPVWEAIEQLLSRLERDAGMAAAVDRSLQPDLLYTRLLAESERMLTLMEHFYSRAYQRSLPEVPELPELPELSERLQRLLTTALEVVEESFGIRPSGNLGERCRRLEQAAWERLYPPVGDGEERCPLQRGLADRLAEETERRLWHMRLVETFTAVSGSYVREQPSQDRFADTLLLLWDTQCRLLGGNPARRPLLGPRHVLISIGEPIRVEERLEGYRQDRRGCVARLTADLQRSLEDLIVPTA
ncbi:glycerol acyltransferase [Synechococcus sp. GFB01]|uniref:glycerol acyltransferase n=1 Tax=Synechococcus sp. GFB01 TaxID=1662190 RepID=UPI00064F7F15|nr:glycerol acyltransferase [Synechococcus sp. GFB01]KMM17474.1 glycerol acyltransferase [Synechococcus sp. GFB01]